ncbi:hypothetical protein AB1Y20_008235 [Prymnesium parvum]|uniref:CS domain-containing protein n=1 Tax=Prymnesium parvum TaxID=97485 RepID=A0AB34IWG5_PRYPA
MAAVASNAKEEEWTPIYKWGQQRSKVVVTVSVPCLDEGKVKTTIRPHSLTFLAERTVALAGGEESLRRYTLHLDLAAEVDEDDSKVYLRHDHVRIELVKKKTATWDTLQLPHIPKNANERPDFDLLSEDGAAEKRTCRERPAGSSRERSERELYHDFCAWVGGMRKRKAKQLRFVLRDMDLRRQNAGLTGGVLYMLLASIVMLLCTLVRFLYGTWAVKVTLVLGLLAAFGWQWGKQALLYLCSELPKPLQDSIASTFRSPRFEDD